VSLARAEFLSEDGDYVVLYDTVTMYVYPVAFDDDEVDPFLEWWKSNHSVTFNGYEGDHYTEYETWIKAGKPYWRDPA
jgi:hypothetical protein